MARKSRLKRRSAQQIEGLIAQTLDRLAAILLRAGLDSPAAESLLRRAFILGASRSTAPTNKKPTQSQIASIAGVSRLEVRRIAADLSRPSFLDSLRSESRVERLVHGWATDRKFTAKNGKPRPLDYRGSNSGFDQLVRSYGRDVTKRTLKLHLVRRGLVKEVGGCLILVRQESKAYTSPEAAADLKYIASQLADIDFKLGRRAYLTSRVSIPATDKKSVHALKRIASTRLGTALSSLASMSPQSVNQATSRLADYRLIVRTTIAIESEGAE